jgi:large subunit ribosomal protein L18
MSVIKRNRTSAKSRKIRVRGKLHGSATRPRLTVFRSNQHLYLQAIDDEAQQTLASATDAGKATKISGNKTERAKALAEKLLKSLQKAEIKAVVFDRGSYKYHGRVKAVAETLREGGIKL